MLTSEQIQRAVELLQEHAHLSRALAALSAEQRVELRVGGMTFDVKASGLLTMFATDLAIKATDIGRELAHLGVRAPDIEVPHVSNRP